MEKYLSFSRTPESTIKFLLYLCLTFVITFGFIAIVYAGSGDGSEGTSNYSDTTVLPETILNGKLTVTHNIGAAINLLLLSEPLSITSLSTNSPLPLTPLLINTSGVDPTLPISVQFSDKSGFSVTESPIRVGAHGRIIVVGVPLYVNPTTGQTGPDIMSLMLTQGSKSTPPITVNVQDLPALSTYGTQLGEISHSFLDFRVQLLGRRIGQLQAASLLFGVDTSELQSTLKADLTAVVLARSDVDSIMLDNSTVITNGTLPNGTVIQWDQNSQDVMDRIIAVYLLQQFGDITSSLAVTASSALSSASRELLTPATAADLEKIMDVIGDSRNLPNFIRDIQTSESGLDAALATLTTGLAYIPDSVAVLGEKELANKLGFGFSIFGIGRAGVDISYDFASFCIDSYYGGDPAAIAQDKANLDKSSVKLLDAGISALSLGFLEGVKAGTSDSIPFFGLGLALRDAQMLKSLAGFEDETTSYVAFHFPNLFPSSNQGFGKITGTAPALSSIDLRPFGTGDLGIQGIVDPNGYYEIFVPLNVSETNYSTLTLSYGDFNTGSIWGSETVDLSGLNTSQPIEMPALTCDTGRCYDLCFDAYIDCYHNCPSEPPIPALNCMNACDQAYWACPSYTDPTTCTCR